MSGLKALYANIGMLITASLHMDEILNGLMEEIRMYFNPENWSLLRLDPASEELFFVVIQGVDTKSVEHIRLSLGEGIAGTVAQTGEPVFIPDTSKSDIFSPKVDEATGFTTRSVIAVPLIFRGQIHGVIELINTLDKDGFTEEDFYVLTTIADYAAIALANAAIYEEALLTAHTDPLTGLSNRLDMDKTLKEWELESAQSRREGDKADRMIAIIIDLDNFKLLNDTLGHKAGDNLLRAAAKGFRHALRSSDRIFRIGGDEFLAMIRINRNCDAEKIMTRLAVKIKDIWIPYMEETDPPVTISCGMSTGLIGDAEKVIHQADMKMYEAKNKRKAEQKMER